MKKMVYVAKCADLRNSGRETGDEFLINFSFDLEEAKEKLKSDFEHLTEKEKKKNKHWIEGWYIEILENETAEKAFLRFLEEDPNGDACMMGSDFYKELSEL